MPGVVLPPWELSAGWHSWWKIRPQTRRNRAVNGRPRVATESELALDLVDYQRKAGDAVMAFWGNRDASEEKQVGSGKTDRSERASVASADNLDGFSALILDLVRANGLVRAEIHQKGVAPALPGYFRPTKLWDLLVTHKGDLVAAVQLKGLAGPLIGDHFSRRSEEAIGTAHDFWGAYRKDAFGKRSRPFVGWLMLVEDASASSSPVKNASPRFPVFPEFETSSYIKRCDLLCQRLVKERLYTSAALITCKRSAVSTGEYAEISAMTGLKAFVSALAGHVAAEASRLE